MSRTNRGDIQGFHLFDGFQEEAAERPQDGPVVIFERIVVIAHRVVENALVGIVRAERVAREQHLVFGQIRVHTVRPVQVGRADETKRLAAQIQAVAVLDGLLREGLVHDVGQITQGRT
ncbi:MAG: hypothetical protein K2L79_06195, partial [Bacteroidales bacterium]|nr:hypothetical protein [Bacteroidales bacterium]